MGPTRKGGPALLFSQEACPGPRLPIWDRISIELLRDNRGPENKGTEHKRPVH